MVVTIRSSRVAYGMLFVAILLTFSFIGVAETHNKKPDDLGECTVVIVGKDASADGSVMTTHTVDGWYDSRLRVIQGGEHEEGEMVKVYKGRLHNDRPDVEKEVIGKIPQVDETYNYFEVAYPFMNEHQVAMGESTFGSREANHNYNTAWLHIDNLERLALQRATSAREAIKIMGNLAEEYGFRGWGGEAVSVVDENEAWIFEIVGPGPMWTQDSDRPGAVWAAKRIPDDAVYVEANRSRIGQLDLDSDDVMASPNVKSRAKEKGWWDPDEEPFSFWKAYAPDPYGQPYYQRRREWRVFDLLAPNKDLDPYAVNHPFYVKPEEKVSVEDLMEVKRDYYEGTQFDMTEGMAAGPYGTPNRYATPSEDKPEGKKHLGWERTISIFRCSNSFISQSRDWLPDPIGGLAWFGMDAPHTTVYMPIYAGVNEVHESLQVMDRTNFTRDSAWWAFDFVSNWADLAYDYMIEDIKEKQQKFEGEFLAMRESVDSAAADLYEEDPELARSFITNYSSSSVERVVSAWWNLADKLIEKYNDGYINQEAKGYPTWWLEEVDFGESTRIPEEYMDDLEPEEREDYQ